MTTREIELAGYEAYLNDKTVNANPHKSGSIESASWKRGWMEAKKFHSVNRGSFTSNYDFQMSFS